MRVRAWWALGFLLLAAQACGARPAVEPPTAALPLVWPAPPAEPRIRWVRSVSGPRDAGIEPSFFGWLAERALGRTEEQFVRPTGVAAAAGALFVADPGAQALWIFDSRGQRATKVSRAATTALVSPVAVAPGRDGTVYVADSALRKVFLFRRTGELVRTAAEAGLERPAGIAFDPETGRVYVADSMGQQIAVYDTTGARVSSWGGRGSGPGQFNHPTHLALDRPGRILVTDALNFRVQAFDRAGRFLWTMGRQGNGSGDFASPKGVAADSHGNVYVVDALFDAVQIFEPGGTLLLGFGERGVQAGQFWLPGGIFIGLDDRIYVADAYNRRIQVFGLLGGAR
jgi:DNA-binding beta-propeller fold protein YncE